jgi:DNA-binding CsgD family transcriptional regulator
MGLSVECVNPSEYEHARASWLEQHIGFDTLYFGAATPLDVSPIAVTGVASSYVSRCEAQADRYWADRVWLNTLAEQHAGVIEDGEVLTVRERDSMPFYREVVRGLGLSRVAVSVMHMFGRQTRALYLGRTARGTRFSRVLSVLRDALPILALGAELHEGRTHVHARARVATGAQVPDHVAPRPGDEATPSSLSSLTPREREVLLWVARGLTNHEIATVLGTSPRTIKNQVASVLEKTGSINRTQLAVLAARLVGAA